MKKTILFISMICIFCTFCNAQVCTEVFGIPFKSSYNVAYGKIIQRFGSQNMNVTANDMIIYERHVDSSTRFIWDHSTHSDIDLQYGGFKWDAIFLSFQPYRGYSVFNTAGLVSRGYSEEREAFAFADKLFEKLRQSYTRVKSISNGRDPRHIGGANPVDPNLAGWSIRVIGKNVDYGGRVYEVWLQYGPYDYQSESYTQNDKF